MLTSLRWLNQYLDPATLTADEAEHVLTFVGFPVESREDLPSGDVKLDVELTSNRGDCLSHLGLAREVAAATGRALLPPRVDELKTIATDVASVTSIDNRLAAPSAVAAGLIGCPRFTARIIRGVRIAPSPAWLRERLESVGLRPINNIVDITNFINLELGHPCHVFDLDTLAGRKLIVRAAATGETIVALDGRTHTLRETDMVVADADKPVSIAGIIGGLHSGVTDRTTTILFEMATWDPRAVRRTARRLDIRTDASHRFERTVDPRDIDAAAARAVALIHELAGGEILAGMIDASAPLPPRTEVFLRPARCRHILGIDVPSARISTLLSSIGVKVEASMHDGAERLRCTIPPHRHDVSREIDLIEEVARLNGLDKITLAPALDVHLELNHPQDWSRRERATATIEQTLGGLGFFETVTFSFITKEHAKLFCPPGLRLLQVDEERRKGAPFLRPSIIPSLLTCRKANQDGQVRAAAGIRLFETASVFAEEDDGKAFARRTVERRTLALLADAPTGLKPAESKQESLRMIRGAVEAVVRAVGGPAAASTVTIEPADCPWPAFAAESFANVSLAGTRIGYIATITAKTLSAWALESPVVAAEISLDPLIALYPPRILVRELPRFPAIERDLSLVVPEETPWARCESTVRAAAPANWLESLDFVGAYRGKPLDAGKKSLTMRLIFRDESRTLRNEELDDPMNKVMASARATLGAQIRGVDVQ
jgi:phenylalanyl-tRNA synthetase beta chain